MMNQKPKKISIYCRGRAPLTKNLMRELKQTTTLAKSGGPSRAFSRSSTSSRLLNNSHHHTMGWSRATTPTMHQARVILSVSSIGSLNSATCQVRQLLRYFPYLGKLSQTRTPPQQCQAARVLVFHLDCLPPWIHKINLMIHSGKTSFFLIRSSRSCDHQAQIANIRVSQTCPWIAFPIPGSFPNF